MEISSVQNLCVHLISCSFQRCRVANDLCRLSVVLKSSPASDTLQISISDTGIGSCLEEFQGLKYPSDCVGTGNWDGLLSVTTTRIDDDEIYRYHINIRESISTRRLTRLPSNSKNGVKFSGTEVYLSISGRVDVLLAEINRFFQKILILKIPNVAIELVAERGDVAGLQYKNVMLANECNPLPFLALNVERLESCLEDYVLRHGNTLSKKCDSCFPKWEPLKIGSGVASCSESHKSTGLVVEAVLIISEPSEPTSPCLRECNMKTEVLYFKDYLPCSISQSTLNALSCVDWKSYGLTLASVVDQGGCALMEWENLPSCAHIDMLLHCYHKQYPTIICFIFLQKTTQSDRNLTKKAVKLALDNLKEKHAGALVSAHALKICSHAPDLASSIAGLILSSNDSDFQGECFSLLGLQFQEIEREAVEDCIKGKIISVIEMNDRKPQRSKEVASFLFEEDCLDDPRLQDEESDESEGGF
ncbi:hypothetical protein CFOL_v3_04550, partial [Cephalotus follicularis]